jgi:hypothetical protein
MTAPTPDLRLYDRRCAVFVGRSGASTADGRASGYRFEGPSSELGQLKTGLRITFEVEQAIEAKTNKASAKIYDLSPTSRAHFEDFKRAIFKIEAGYAPTSGLIFDGEAVHVSSARIPGGFETTISAHDGLQAKRGIVNAALAPGASIGQAVQQIAAAMGVRANRAVAKALAGDFNGSIGTFLGGLTLSGPADQAMDDLANAAGFDWTIVNGELFLVHDLSTIDEEVVILGPESGLIGSPERKFDDKKPRAVLVNAKSLMNPRLVVGRRVRYRSSEISGDFRINRVKHIGDTHGNDWYSTIETVPV